jgi:lipoprotein-anchoring transpeptidase ErfK/SrfK
VKSVLAVQRSEEHEDIVGCRGKSRPHARRWLRLAGSTIIAIALCACAERSRQSSEPQPPARHDEARAQGSAPAVAAAALPPTPSGPPVRLFAKRFVVKVRREPARQSPRIGYLRGGAVMQATSAEPLGYDECRKGWYGLDTGGFVCATLDLTPFTGKRPPERQPLLPDLTTPLPYPYGYSKRRNTPMFRRLPSDAEAVEYDSEGKLVATVAGASPAAAPHPVDLPSPVPDASPLVAAAAGDDMGEGHEPAVPTLASLMGDQSSVLIDVDLDAQSLVAYVGSEPVYATLISSGRIKDELDPQKNFQSPTGAFRILSKHLTATMDGDHALDGPYSIEDVPYVMYFQLAYALHSAFWHNGFGRPHSHGCINLAPLDAKWIFEFAEPALPKGWHGVYPKDRLGTRLYIHGTTPPG